MLPSPGAAHGEARRRRRRRPLAVIQRRSALGYGRSPAPAQQPGLRQVGHQAIGGVRIRPATGPFCNALRVTLHRVRARPSRWVAVFLGRGIEAERATARRHLVQHHGFQAAVGGWLGGSSTARSTIWMPQSSSWLTPCPRASAARVL